MRRAYSAKEKQTIIHMVLDCQRSAEEVASLLNMSSSTVRNMVKNFLDSGRTYDARCDNYRPSILSTEERVLAIQCVMESPTITQVNVVDTLSAANGTVVHQSTISRVFKAENITLKSISEVPQARNSPENLLRRQEYANWMTAEIGEGLVDALASRITYIDEVGVNCNLHRNQGWSFKGDRTYISTCTQRGGNVSSFGALSPTRGFWLSSILGPFRHTSFLSELECYMDFHNHAIPVGGFIFVMDNVPFHHHNSIRELIETRGHHLVFIPPYSPFLNAIENAFSKLKNEAAKALMESRRCPDSVSEALRRGALQITLQDCVGYHENVKSYLPSCSALMPIQN
jgi:transposase